MAVVKQFPQITAPYCIALEKSIGAVLYHTSETKTKFLIMQYPHGHWEFPRGHIEIGESEIETMYREIEEETSIKKSELEIQEDFLESFVFSYRARGDEKKDRKKKKKCLFIRKKVVFYLAKTTQNRIKLSHEHEKCKWLTYEEAMDRLTFENAQKVITKAHEYIQKNNA